MLSRLPPLHDIDTGSRPQRLDSVQNTSAGVVFDYEQLGRKSCYKRNRQHPRTPVERELPESYQMPPADPYSSGGGSPVAG